MNFRAIHLAKSFPLGTQQIHALRNISVSFRESEFTAIMGPSGSGKSTLLHLLSGLDRPTTGEIYFNHQPIHTLDENSLAALRRRQFGFVFQFFNLLPTLNAFENVALPLLLDGYPMSQIKAQALQQLDAVGLSHRAEHYPTQLSGGEMQRVAIARALIAHPKMIFADEPTGNLDTKTGTHILESLKKLVTEKKLTLIMVTHDPKAAAYADRLIELRDGLIEKDSNPALEILTPHT